MSRGIGAFFMPGRTAKHSIPRCERKPNVYQNSGRYAKFPSCSDAVGQIIRAEQAEAENGIGTETESSDQ